MIRGVGPVCSKKLVKTKQGQGVPVNEEKWRYWLKKAELSQDSHARQGVEMAILNDYASGNTRPV